VKSSLNTRVLRKKEWGEAMDGSEKKGEFLGNQAFVGTSHF